MLLYLCAFLVFGLGFFSKLVHACILPARAGQSMLMHVAGLHTQAFACMRIPLPRNPNSGFCFIFFDYFTCYAFVLTIFIDISLCFSVYCLFDFQIFKLGVILPFSYFNTRNTHSHVHALMPKVL